MRHVIYINISTFYSGAYQNILHFLNDDINIEIGFRLIPVSTTAVCSTMTKRDSWVRKGNNKTTEHRAILQRERQNSQVNKQTKSVNNRKTGKTTTAPTRHRHLQRNGGLNQTPRRQTSRPHHGSKAPAVTITVPRHRNKIGKIVVKAVPHSAT